MTDNQFDLKSLLSTLANMTAGKSNKNLDVAKTVMNFTGMNQVFFTWALKKIINNPNLAKALFQVKSAVTKENSDAYLKFVTSVLLPSENEVTVMIGIVSVGIVHKKFPLDQESRKDIVKMLKKLLIHEDAKIKDCATVVLGMLEDGYVDFAESAQDRLSRNGFDIIKAIEC